MARRTAEERAEKKLAAAVKSNSSADAANNVVSSTVPDSDADLVGHRTPPPLSDDEIEDLDEENQSYLDALQNKIGVVNTKRQKTDDTNNERSMLDDLGNDDISSHASRIVNSMEYI